MYGVACLEGGFKSGEWRVVQSLHCVCVCVCVRERERRRERERERENATSHGVLQKCYYI